MFNDTKYTHAYFRLMTKFQSYEIKEYSEIHHIIPRSLGGKNTPDNLVKLTAKAHYIAHLLLTKMGMNENQRQKMICAFIAMANLGGEQRYQVSGRLYGSIKRQWSEIASVRYSGDGNPYAKRKHSEETRKKMSEAAKKPSRITQAKANLPEHRFVTGHIPHNTGKSIPQEIRERIRDSSTGEKNHFYGKHHSEESRRKMSESHNAEPKKYCYSCGKEFDSRNYGRWHGDRCKYK